MRHFFRGLFISVVAAVGSFAVTANPIQTTIEHEQRDILTEYQQGMWNAFLQTTQAKLQKVNFEGLEESLLDTTRPDSNLTDVQEACFDRLIEQLPMLQDPAIIQKIALLAQYQPTLEERFAKQYFIDLLYAPTEELTGLDLDLQKAMKESLVKIHLEQLQDSNHTKEWVLTLAQFDFMQQLAQEYQDSDTYRLIEQAKQACIKDEQRQQTMLWLMQLQAESEQDNKLLSADEQLIVKTLNTR